MNPSSSSRGGGVWLLCSLILLSAFLLFQVQPVISKFILPWFGGSPGVWTTCMLFFQVVLFAGYAYAHGLTLLPRRAQVVVHGVLVLAAAACLPVTPGAGWKPQGAEDPTLRILLLLGATVGLPYFVLSSTSPLVQVWFTRAAAGRQPWRLYALSNVGSLTALLSYPFFIERRLDVAGQALAWSVAFGIVAVLTLAALRLDARAARMKAEAGGEVKAPEPAEPAAGDAVPRWWHRLLWVLLPALASVLLLAATSHVCQDVAVIPFLWVVPLSLYLLTFIICFEHERWYVRPVWALLACAGLVLAAGYMQIPEDLRSMSVFSNMADWEEWLNEFDLAPTFIHEISFCFAGMFLACMVCHGELTRLKPTPRRLTEFYLLMSAGGALGGLVTALVAPRVFATYLEWPLGLMAAFVVAAVVLVGCAWRARWRWLRLVGVLVVAALAVFGLGCMSLWISETPERLVRVRNFYGAVSIEEETDDDGDTYRTLHHGGIVHGVQFIDGPWREEPLSYYGPSTGIGMAMAMLKDRPDARVGVVGMGTATMACFGRKGHTFRFYEINPEIVRLARAYFPALEDLEKRGGTVQVIIGDARLSLEREAAQQFDVLLLDAFSGDAVPVHLLTREAFEIYKRHMKPDGIIAVHVSNRYLVLTPVVEKIARAVGMKTTHIASDEDGFHEYTDYVLVTNNEAFLQAHPNEPLAEEDQIDPPLWTDQNHNLFDILDYD